MVYNKGIYTKGKYNTINDKNAYKTWKNILQRCYDEKTLTKYPSYKGCEICNYWIYFQNFADWYYQNYIDGYTLDKDILGDGKLYSPETCCFVPNHINNLLHTNKHIINLNKENKYRVRINTLTIKRKHIGYFDNKEDAQIAYNKAKRDAIDEILKFYDINDKISNAIINKLWKEIQHNNRTLSSVTKTL